MSSTLSDLQDDSTDGISPRTILLLGSPRSGTSWLAKILDTYEDVFYVHEPLQKRRDACMQPFIRRIVTDGELAPDERHDLLAILRQPHYENLFPPFFRKTFLRRSPRALMLLWLLRRMFRWSDPIFRTWSGPKQGGSFDLLIKEVDWQSHAENVVSGLQPDCLILIVRHPCGVVCSRVRGLQLGVIFGHERKQWFNHNAAGCEQLGYSGTAVEKMSEWEFYALDWVLQNQKYRSIARKHTCVTTVLYKELCRDPLAVAERLFNFLSWPLGPATMRFIRATTNTSFRQTLLKRFWGRRYFYDLHKNPRESATAWTRRLTDDQQKAILAIARHFEEFEEWFGGARMDDDGAALPASPVHPLPVTDGRAVLDCGSV